MLVDVGKIEKLGDLKLEGVDFIGVGVKSLEEVCSLGKKGGDVMKKDEDNSPSGKWCTGEYSARMEVGGYTITFGTQFKEKCDQCSLSTPCCVVGCEVYKWKEIEEDNPCRYCKLDGICYGNMDRFSDYYTEFTKGEFRVKHKGKYWTLGGISRLETSIDKLVLYFKYVNMAYRYYDCEELMFKVKKTEDKVIVSFQGVLYHFPKDMSKQEIMLKVFRKVDTYCLSKIS